MQTQTEKEKIEQEKMRLSNIQELSAQLPPELVAKLYTDVVREALNQAPSLKAFMKEEDEVATKRKFRRLQKPRDPEPKDEE